MRAAMLAFASWTRARGITVVILAAATIAALTGQASAFRLSGTYSSSDIQSHCDKAGGVYTSNNDNSTYQCTTSGGQVTCGSNGTCYGSCKNCPAIVRHNGTVIGVLSGIPLKAGTNAATKTTLTPAGAKLPDSNPGVATNTHDPHHEKK